MYIAKIKKYFSHIYILPLKFTMKLLWYFL